MPLAEQQPTLSSSNVDNQTASSIAHLKKDSDRYHQFLFPCQPSSAPNPMDSCQESLCCWCHACVIPDAQLQRGATEAINVDQFELIKNSQMVEPLSLMMRKNQSERRIPVALKVPYSYVIDLLALESHRRGVVLPNQLQKIITPLKWWAWEAALISHPDAEFHEYITWGTREGFWEGYNERISHKLVVANILICYPASATSGTISVREM